MTKTIGVLALMASASSAMALMPFVPPGTPAPKVKHICLSVGRYEDGSPGNLGHCDKTANNATLHLKLNANGCADGQVSVVSIGQDSFSTVYSCMPVGAVQL